MASNSLLSNNIVNRSQLTILKKLEREKEELVITYDSNNVNVIEKREFDNGVYYYNLIEEEQFVFMSEVRRLNNGYQYIDGCILDNNNPENQLTYSHIRNQKQDVNTPLAGINKVYHYQILGASGIFKGFQSVILDATNDIRKVILT